MTRAQSKITKSLFAFTVSLAANSQFIFETSISWTVLLYFLGQGGWHKIVNLMKAETGFYSLE
jgi:hypothetical protein